MHLQRILLIVPSALGGIVLGLVIFGLLPWAVDSSAAPEMNFIDDEELFKLLFLAKEIAVVCFGLSVLMALVGGLAKPVGLLSRGVIFVLSLLAFAACFLYVTPYSTFLATQFGIPIEIHTELLWPSFSAWVTISSAVVLILSTLVVGRIGEIDLTADSVGGKARSNQHTSGQLKTGLIQAGIVLICAVCLMFALRGKSADQQVGERFQSNKGASTMPSEETNSPGSDPVVKYYGLHPTGSVVKPSWPAAPPEDAPTVKVKIDELLADFEESPQKTKDSLEGKWVEMTAEVMRVDAFLSDYADGSHYTRLSLQKENNVNIWLFCFMRDAKPWTKTSQGSEVTVRAVFGCEGDQPHLDHGRIVAGLNSPTKEITIEDLLQEYSTDPETFRKTYRLPYFTKQIIVSGAFAKKIDSDKHLLIGKNNERLVIEGSLLSYFRLPKEGRVINVMGELREDTLDGSDKPEIYLWNVVPVDFFESDSNQKE